MQAFIKLMCESARKFNAITRTNIKRLFKQPNLLLNISNFGVFLVLNISNFATICKRIINTYPQERRQENNFSVGFLAFAISNYSS